MKKDTNSEIEKILRSLDEVQRIKVSPHFYERIQQKLDRQEVLRINWLRAVAVAIVLLGLNISAIAWMQSSEMMNTETAIYLESEGYFSTMNVNNTMDFSTTLEIEQ